MSKNASVESPLIQRVSALEDDMVRLTCDLVRIPTVNPYSGDRSAGTERPGQEFLNDYFRKHLSAETRFSEPPEDVYARAGFLGPKGRSWKGRPNLVATLKVGSGKGPTVILNNHMDTVGTEGMRIDPYAAKVEEGKIWGRGTSDTKANTATGLIAIRALLDSSAAKDCSGTIIFESVVDEECNGSGAGTLWCCLEGVRGDAAICLDGGGAVPYRACNGIVTYELRVPGVAGHASFGGAVNAIDKAIHVKLALDQFKARRERANPAVRVNLGVFKAGSIPAMIPGEALLGLNIAYSAMEALAAERSPQHGRWGGGAVRQEFLACVAEAAGRDAFLAEHPVQSELIKDVYPFDTPADAPLVQAACRAVEAVRGKPVEACLLEAWCDASHLSRQGKMQTVGLGSGVEGTAHSDTEYADIALLREGASALAILLHDLLSSK